MSGETQATSAPTDRIVAESIAGPRLHESRPPIRPYLERARELVVERAVLGAG